MRSVSFKNRCDSCKGAIVFPASSVGEQISCPHCDRLITLIFPSEQEGGASKLVDLYLQSSAFPSKRPELFLLSQFAHFPLELDHLRGVDNWRAALGVEPSTVVGRFIQQAMLRNGSDDVVALLQTKSVSELKALAASRGLRKSDTKEVLAKRLFEHDPEGMRQTFRKKAYLICTEKGRLIADKYLESEDEIKAQCEQSTLSALMEGRLKDACLLVASFEASHVFPRGIGIDWHKYDSNYDLAVLQFIFTMQPPRHASFDPDAIPRVRIGASMMHLWGVNKVPGCALNGGGDLTVPSRMLLFAALGSVHLQEMKRVGIKRVKVLASGQPEICSVCRSANGETYPIASAPRLPHDECTCEAGCACLIVADQ